jgi:hypothetical protein
LWRSRDEFFIKTIFSKLCIAFNTDFSGDFKSHIDFAGDYVIEMEINKNLLIQSNENMENRKNP